MGRKSLSSARGVTAPTRTSFCLTFTYKGETWRPRIKVSDTSKPENKKYAAKLLTQVLLDIDKNDFDPIKYFPNYSKSKRIAKTQTDNLLTVEKLLRRFFKSDQTTKGLQQSTYDINWRKTVNSLIPRLGHYPAHTLDRVQITKAMVDDRVPAVSNKTISNELSILRTAFAWYMGIDNTFNNWCLMDVNGNAWTPKSIIKKQGDEIDPFTHNEVSLILAACDQVFDASYANKIRNPITVMYWQGLRISECVGLKWPDIDFEKNTIKIHAALVEGKYQDRPKTKNGIRIVKMLGETRKALLNQKKYTYWQGDFVFVDPANDKPFGSSSYLNRYWTKLFTVLDFKYRPAKQLRHSWATYALASGENDQWIANQIGHYSPNFTRQTYFRFIENLYPDAGNKMEQLREFNLKD